MRNPFDHPLHPSPFVPAAPGDIHTLLASEAEWSRYTSTVRLTQPPTDFGGRVTFRHVADRPCRLVGILAAHARLEEVLVGNKIVYQERVYGAPPVLFPGVVVAINVVIVNSEHSAEVVLDFESPEPLEPEPRERSARARGVP